MPNPNQSKSTQQSSKTVHHQVQQPQQGFPEFPNVWQESVDNDTSISHSTEFEQDLADVGISHSNEQYQNYSNSNSNDLSQSAESNRVHHDRHHQYHFTNENKPVKMKHSAQTLASSNTFPLHPSNSQTSQNFPNSSNLPTSQNLQNLSSHLNTGQWAYPGAKLERLHTGTTMATNATMCDTSFELQSSSSNYNSNNNNHNHIGVSNNHQHSSSQFHQNENDYEKKYKALSAIHSNKLADLTDHTIPNPISDSIPSPIPYHLHARRSSLPAIFSGTWAHSKQTPTHRKRIRNLSEYDLNDNGNGNENEYRYRSENGHGLQNIFSNTFPKIQAGNKYNGGGIGSSTGVGSSKSLRRLQATNSRNSGYLKYPASQHYGTKASNSSTRNSHHDHSQNRQHQTSYSGHYASSQMPFIKRFYRWLLVGGKDQRFVDHHEKFGNANGPSSRAGSRVGSRANSRTSSRPNSRANSLPNERIPNNGFIGITRESPKEAEQYHQQGKEEEGISSRDRQIVIKNYEKFPSQQIRFLCGGRVFASSKIELSVVVLVIVLITGVLFLVFVYVLIFFFSFSIDQLSVWIVY